jgi:hypothetical protein
METQTEWHTYIADHIQHVAYCRPETYGDRKEIAYTNVIDSCITLALESGQLNSIILTALSDRDDAGFELGKLIEKEIEGYCERQQEELKGLFPVEFADFKEIDEGDEVEQ